MLNPRLLFSSLLLILGQAVSAQIVHVIQTAQVTISLNGDAVTSGFCNDDVDLYSLGAGFSFELSGIDGCYFDEFYSEGSLGAFSNSNPDLQLLTHTGNCATQMKRLSEGILIGPSSGDFQYGGFLFQEDNQCVDVLNSHFYIAFRKKNGSDYNYGWVRASAAAQVLDELTTYTVTLYEYAYQTSPNVSIEAGNQGPDCMVFESAPVNLSKSLRPVPYPDGVIDRIQLKWYKESPQVKYTDEDAAACDIKYWAKRNLDSATGDPVGPPIDDSEIIMKENVLKSYPDGSPRSIFKWPVRFRADGADNSKRVNPNTRYEWQVRCACNHGAGLESPWSEVKVLNTPDFNPVTGVYFPEEGGFLDSVKDIDDDLDIELSIFPNPSDGTFLSIDYRGSYKGLTQIQVIDLMGREYVSEKYVDLEVK